MQKNSLPEPIYSDFVVNQQPVRNIRAELYDHKGYDAIWRLSNAGFAVDGLEEWISNKKSRPGKRAKAENRSRKEIPLFLALRAKLIS